ncbi:MAG: hypothetical protein H6882_11660 [Rhodobiaceae bacterium]|nr:hypothetical protein [Rhodobiaceae bacterium]
MARFARILQLFRLDELFLFKFGKLGFVGGDHRGVLSANDTFQQLIDLPVNRADIAFDRGRRVLGLCQPLVPGILEHGLGQREQIVGGLK